MAKIKKINIIETLPAAQVSQIKNENVDLRAKNQKISKIAIGVIATAAVLTAAYVFASTAAASATECTPARFRPALGNFPGINYC